MTGWGDWGLFVTLLIITVFLYGVGLVGRLSTPTARPWQSVYVVFGILLLPFMLFQFIQAVGGNAGRGPQRLLGAARDRRRRRVRGAGRRRPLRAAARLDRGDRLLVGALGQDPLERALRPLRDLPRAAGHPTACCSWPARSPSTDSTRSHACGPAAPAPPSPIAGCAPRTSSPARRSPPSRPGRSRSPRSSRRRSVFAVPRGVAEPAVGHRAAGRVAARRDLGLAVRGSRPDLRRGDRPADLPDRSSAARSASTSRSRRSSAGR